MNPLSPPDALLFIAPGCPHCPAVADSLSRLLKEGVIGRLEIVNAAIHTQEAGDLGVRSVPWLRLGEFEFEGAMKPAELQSWAEVVDTPAGLEDYLRETLTSGRLDRAVAMAGRSGSHLGALLALMDDPDTGLNVRIGISAVMEDLAGSPALRDCIDQLAGFTRADDAAIRADACHYLGLTEDTAALSALEACVRDANPDVREAAADAIDALHEP